MGAHQQIKPAMSPSNVIKAMLELNAAGNRAILRPDGSLVSEPMQPGTDPDLASLVNWSRPE